MKRGHCTICGVKQNNLVAGLCEKCFVEHQKEKETKKIVTSSLSRSIPDLSMRPTKEELYRIPRSEWTKQDWHWHRTFNAETSAFNKKEMDAFNRKNQ